MIMMMMMMMMIKKQKLIKHTQLNEIETYRKRVMTKTVCLTVVVEY
jgi:hypothetical protein